MKYGTFWQRFVAMWIDIAVLLPLTFLSVWVESYSKVLTMVLLVPLSVCGVAYYIYCHGRFGQTIGKKVVGVRVVKLTGEQIGWREAWLRSSVESAFITIILFPQMYALAVIPDADFYVKSWWERGENLAALQPSWVIGLSIGMSLWMWSEVIVMLFNEKRRALHDFIAGTVVISEPAAAAPPILTVNGVEPGV